MTNIKRLKGYAFAKKKGDDIYVFEEGQQTLGDSTPVIAEGSTVPRMLKDRFADVANVKDFGAVGDGVTDDAQSFKNASQKFKKVFLANQTYNVSEYPNIICNNGNIIFEGKNITVDGVSFKNIKQNINLFIEPPKEYDYKTPQGFCIFEYNGKTRCIVSYVVEGTSGLANQKTILFDYEISLETFEIKYLSQTQPLYLGHGEGIGVRVVNDAIYLYMQEKNDGSDSEYTSCGVSIVNYKGSTTSNSDITSYKLVDENKYINFVPTISPDGTKVIGYSTSTSGTNNRVCFIYDLNKIILSEDSTTVEPEQTFIVEFSNLSGYTIQGISCDSKFIYFSYGSGAPASYPAIRKYSYSGSFVDEIQYTGLLSNYSRNDLVGKNSSLQQLWKIENEGIVSYKNSLYCLQMMTWITFGSIVSFKGKNYACVATHTSTYAEVPSDTTSYWQYTEAEATDGEWVTGKQYSKGTPDLAHFRCLVELSQDANIGVTKGRFDYSTYNNNRINPVTQQGLGMFIYSYEPVSGDIRHLAYLNNNGLQLYDDRYNDQKERALIRVNLDDEATSGIRFIRIGAINDSSSNADSPYIGIYLASDTTHSSVGGELVLCNGQNEQRLGVDNETIRLRSYNGDNYLSYYAVGLSDSTYRGNFQSTESVTHWRDTSGIALHADYLGDSPASVALRGSTYNGLFPTVSGLSLGRAASTGYWENIYATNGTINTSDERVKESVQEPSEALIRAWGKVRYQVFKFTDAVAEKGDNARLHVGVVAQQVKYAFESEGLDASKYGLFCYDKWDDEYEPVEVVDKPEVLDENGEIITPAVTHTEQKKVISAGDRYGIRYEEALALECAYLRSRLDKLEKEFASRVLL